MQASRAFEQGDLPTAESILRARLIEQPTDIHALVLFARLVSEIGREGHAEDLLRLALESKADANPARFELAALLYRQNRPEEALVIIDEILEDGASLTAMNLRAAAFARAGRFEDSAVAYEDSLRLSPNQARVWMHYAGLLRTTGQNERAVAALRQAISLAPSLGEAWWSLSDLKTAKLTGTDIDRMKSALRSGTLSEKDRYHFYFALGKAYEDSNEIEESFAHYSQGNRIRRRLLDYDPDTLTSYVNEASTKLTRSFFAERQGQGYAAADPIFIVGLPRSGSTLIEQILASHPQIEGTMELPDLLQIAGKLGADNPDYVRTVAQLTAEDREALGHQYIEQTRRYRKTRRPFFIDKMPNNWMHVPLIQLILPNARIIDARRHPLACCLSNFQQHFIGGQPFAYDLTELGRYYSDYVAFMRYIDAALLGRVYRAIHEKLVDDPEREVRALLDYLGLPFDEACLRFHENKRVVRSASSEQVRRPINREGIERWRAYESWLGPLKNAVAQEIDFYPDAPPAR